MPVSSLYTIGYGNRSFDQFAGLLREYSIQYVADIRSIPFSKHNPEFTKQTLFSLCESIGITYLWMGEQLGGIHPEEKENGCVPEYKELVSRKGFSEGLDKLILAERNKIRAVLMCAETDPGKCHRSLLIGKALLEKGIVLQHIDKDGGIISQLDIVGGVPMKDLFGKTV